MPYEKPTPIGWSICSIVRIYSQPLQALGTYVEHVGVGIPRVRVERRRARAINEMTRTVLLEETNHGTATGTTIEPRRQRSRRRVVASLEEPEPHVHVRAHRKVTAVLVDARRGLADAGVLDEFQLSASSGVLEDIVSDAVFMRRLVALVESWSSEGEAAEGQSRRGSELDETHSERYRCQRGPRKR